ncbi:hypothetical protein BC832DRAFT_563598 [Gaertneriomyces semiglobifer]|nr:hypothetical protein BC832DRAFT_563598 [Gaertneriomyces semiglobifer]
MSARDVLNLIASDLKSGSSGLILANLPSPDSSKTLSVLQQYIAGHPFLPATPTSPASSHQSVTKLAIELVNVFRAAFAPKEYPARAPYYLTADQLSFEDIRLLIFATWLKRLLPLYEPARFVGDWWDPFVKPVLTACSWKPLVDICRDITVDLLCAEHWPWTPSTATTTPGISSFRLMFVEAYLEECARMAEQAVVKGSSPHHDVGNSVRAPTPLAIPFWQTKCGSNYENIFLRFGMARAKDFYDVVAQCFASKKHRTYILILLLKFAKRQEAPVYYVAESPLFRTILKSAMCEVNPAVMCACLNVLCTFIPAVAVRLADVLGELLQILVRAVYWETEYAVVLETCGQATQHGVGGPGIPFGVSSAGSLDVADVSKEHASLSDYCTSALGEFTRISARQAVENLYTLLYGLFPNNTLRMVRQYCTQKDPETILAPTSSEWDVADDPFADVRVRVRDDGEVDLTKLARERLQELASSHRMHPLLLLSDPENERIQSKQNPRTPSTIVVECFELRSRGGYWADEIFRRHVDKKKTEETKTMGMDLLLGRVFEAVAYWTGKECVVEESDKKLMERPPGDMGASAATAAENFSKAGGATTSAQVDMYVDMNRAFRSLLLKTRKHAVSPPSSLLKQLDTAPTSQTNDPSLPPQPQLQAHSLPSSSSTEILKLQLALLLTEVNFQSYMRYRHYKYIRKLRKQHMLEEARDATDRQSIYDAYHLQHEEIKALQDALQQYRQEAAVVRDRYRQHEAAMHKHVMEAKEETTVLRERVAELSERVKMMERGVEVVREEQRDAERRAFAKSAELDAVTADLGRLRECEEWMETWSKKVAGTTREAGVTGGVGAGTMGMDGATREREWEMQVEELEREVGVLREALAEQRAEAARAVGKLGTLETMCERLEKDVSEQARVMESVERAAEERIKAVDAKYQTLRNINVQLEDKITELFLLYEEGSRQQQQPSSTALDEKGDHAIVPVTLGNYD